MNQILEKCVTLHVFLVIVSYDIFVFLQESQLLVNPDLLGRVVSELFQNPLVEVTTLKDALKTVSSK